MLKQLMVLMLALLAVSACNAAFAIQEPAPKAVLSKGKAKIDWDGDSFPNVQYKQVGKKKLSMDFYLPAGHPSENKQSPVIYYVHGGGWAAGSKENFGNRLMLPVFRQLAEQGFVCVSIDYRLCKKGSGVLMRDCVTDAFDGLRFLKKHSEQYAIDPDRIVVFGDSAGGQLAQMLTYASPDGFLGDEDLVGYDVQPLAGISWYGPTDFTDVNLFKTDLDDRKPDRFGARISGDEGGYAKNPQAFEAISPYFWIKKDSPPLLMLQGDTDATIPLPHAIHLKKKADRIEADVEMIIVKNAGHNWRKAGGDPDPGLEEIQRITVEYALRQIEPKKGKLHAADFYVSPKGSDAWSGTLPKPDEAGTDGPFATLQRARDAVRELKKEKSRDIVVLVREGTYPLQKTIVFGLEDSGVGDSTITYAAYPDETPVFSSGREITGWQKVTGELPGLPKEAIGKLQVADVSGRFLTLYDDEGMLPRAQSERFVPNGNATELRFPKGRLKNWPNVTDVEIVVRPTRLWTMNVLPLVSVDEQAGVARTAIPATYAMNKIGCWVENVLEELDKPGEWVLNTKEGKVYLWPRGNSPVMAPQLIELLRVEGTIDKQSPQDTPARNLCFRGLTFKHGERYTLTKDDAGTQHDWDMFDKDNALVRLRGAENCVVQQCHFLDSGSGAIRVDLHGQKNKITGNHIEHLGGGGILLCGYGPGTKDVNKNNLVDNNDIHHIGEIYWQSPGIFLCQSGNNRVANNLIHHTNYSGMIVSGIVSRFFVKQNKRESSRAIRWHEIGNVPKNPELEDVRPYLHTRNNLIEDNEIHNVMQILGDGNGIYIRGAGAGNVIRGNYIHHLVSPINGQSGMRTDGGQMDTLFTGNLLYQCKSQGMTLKLNNRFENNIIADVIAPRGVYLKIVEGPMKGATNKRNIFYSSLADCSFISEPGGGTGKVGEDRRGRVPARMKDIESDHNIYFCKADPSLGESTLKKLQGDGVDSNSRAVDPMFVDPENGDFRFQPGSPALEMGIVPFDSSKVGLRSDTK